MAAVCADSSADDTPDGADQALLRLRASLRFASPDDDTCTLAVRVLP